MTQTDTWRRLAAETLDGTTLLFDPAQVFCLQGEGANGSSSASTLHPEPGLARAWLRGSP